MSACRSGWSPTGARAGTARARDLPAAADRGWRRDCARDSDRDHHRRRCDRRGWWKPVGGATPQTSTQPCDARSPTPRPGPARRRPPGTSSLHVAIPADAGNISAGDSGMRCSPCRRRSSSSARTSGRPTGSSGRHAGRGQGVPDGARAHPGRDRRSDHGRRDQHCARTGSGSGSAQLVTSSSGTPTRFRSRRARVATVTTAKWSWRNVRSCLPSGDHASGRRARVGDAARGDRGRRQLARPVPSARTSHTSLTPRGPSA